MQQKNDIRIENAVINITGNQVSDKVRLELIFDSIFSLLNNPEPFTYIEN